MENLPSDSEYVLCFLVYNNTGKNNVVWKVQPQRFSVLVKKEKSWSPNVSPSSQSMHVCLLACLSMHVQNEVKSVSLGTVRKPLSVNRKTVTSVSLGMHSKQTKP